MTLMKRIRPCLKQQRLVVPFKPQLYMTLMKRIRPCLKHQEQKPSAHSSTFNSPRRYVMYPRLVLNASHRSETRGMSPERYCLDPIFVQEAEDVPNCHGKPREPLH